MKASISTPNNGNNGKAMVLSFAEKNGSLKYMDYSDGWLHKDCGGTLSANGKPGWYECRTYTCRLEFKKQPQLANEYERRMERAKDLVGTVIRDNHHPYRFRVSSRSRPKVYIVYKDSHNNFNCPCEDFQKHRKYHHWLCLHCIAIEIYMANERHGNQYGKNGGLSDEEIAWFTDTDQSTDGMSFDQWKEYKRKQDDELWEWFFDENEATDNMDFDKWLEYKRSAVTDRTSLPIRPSLIVTGTQEEFEKANSLDEKQIVRGDDGVWGYLINGKVAISYCGTMKLRKQVTSG